MGLHLYNPNKRLHLHSAQITPSSTFPSPSLTLQSNHHHCQCTMAPPLHFTTNKQEAPPTTTYHDFRPTSSPFRCHRPFPPNIPPLQISLSPPDREYSHHGFCDYQLGPRLLHPCPGHRSSDLEPNIKLGFVDPGPLSLSLPTPPNPIGVCSGWTAWQLSVMVLGS